MVHAIDTLMTTSILPIMPSLEPIVLFNRNIASKAPALWRLLTSPEAQSVFEKPVHDILASLSSRLPRIGSALDIEQLSHNTATALANFFAGMASSDLGTTYIEDFTNSILVVDPAVDPNANTSLFQPVWTYISKCLHELSYIKQWDHSVWTRIAGLDARIARLADYMREISRGLTFSDRLTLIVIGVLICVYLAWHTVQTTSPDMRHKAHYQFSRLILMMAKIVFFVVIEIVLFPMLCGYCLDISLTPVLPEANRSSHYWAILNNSLSLRAAYWLAGLIFMIHFARFIAYCRQVMRPGLLWFIRDPNDAEFHPMREALEDRPISQKSKISRSAVMYCGTMLACIGVPSIAAAKIAPKAFPLHVDMTVNLNDYPVSVLYAVLSLFILLKWGRPYVLLRFLLDHWWQFAARTTRLSEFTLNQHDVLDEGKWVIRRAPLIPVVLPRFWMPTHVIKKAYEEVSQDAADKARFSDAENAIPTLEFNTLLQNKIDAALAESHPWVEFVLDGQNVRVPALDTVAVVAGRQMLVPVDDFGRPIEDKFDYEAADYPELQNVDDNDDQDAVRDLPPPAPDNNLRDLRFKAAQHKVIHVPPSLHMRVCMFMILGWAAIASFATVTFVLSLKIGKLCISRMGDMPRNDLVVLAIGLLLLLIGCESVYQLGVYIGSMYDLHGNWTQRFSESKRQIWRTVVTAWKTLVTAFVFLGVLPALYGKVLEVYLVTIVQMYVDNASARYKFARNMIQFMGHHWLFSLLHIWTIMSLLRAFPNSRLARTIDRLFAGPPHTWQVWRAIIEIGLPVGGVALLCSSLPFGLSIIDLWQQDRLTTEHVLTLIMMKDIRLIAKNSILIILSAVSAGIVWQACIIYKRWSRLARDRMYLVGQQLQNLGDNDLEVDQEGDVVDDFHPDEADDHLVVGAE
ncbi:hypothetical protein LPJ73_001822 [Coemansia sp. RSA 2703]|nr:hypothetical protein LPJ73_001822 [Coemansia sp. RSA 2703]